MLEVSEGALEVLERAHSAATRLNPDAKVRIFRRSGVVETGFADAPESGDTVLELDSNSNDGRILTIFVEEGISGVLDVSAEHDRLVVRS